MSMSFGAVTFQVLLLALLIAALLNPVQFDADAISEASVADARVLLVTAHPDDEASPGITADEHQGTPVYSLCLSVGNADGLGSMRRREFGASLDALGVPERRRWVLDNPDLQDNFTATWDANLIAEAVRPYVTSSAITTILTFDREGVSQHPNHRSIREGVRTLLTSPDAPLTHPRFFTLATVPTVSKYLWVIAPLQAKLDLTMAAALHAFEDVYASLVGNETPKHADSSAPATPEYGAALFAMLQHKSQMVWFRYLYICFSRYMWVNEWFEVKVPV
ncbi:putative deacetylase LmbE-like domain-containing protein [Schizophyllum amplum]|uniref:N-acetylglucosaminylphosphatidylinositol deacetylase n=1 Tax=Schizophyllum amplum TaxID=97359 RepID=A0A550C6L2_9AGAR|nr:putative deacetylase LmbE-like domain-containing protein [Auriculariopsis ampla]